MDYDLSVLVPGIRTKNWLNLYNTTAEAFSMNWEIIFVGPYPPPPEIAGKENVVYIEDWGTPIRCQQIALTRSRGEWITWAADDGQFLLNSLDIAFSKIENYKTVVMGKYIEGRDNGDFPMSGDDYYHLAKHTGSFTKEMPEDFLMLNVGIISKKLLLEFGGWDCRFEVCPMAYNDLAMRLQSHGIKFIIQDEVMYTCSHTPGRQGDHGPIHDAQIEKDEPLFREIYGRWCWRDRGAIDVDNWKKVPDKWRRRFG